MSSRSAVFHRQLLMAPYTSDRGDLSSDHSFPADCEARTYAKSRLIILAVSLTQMGQSTKSLRDICGEARVPAIALAD